MRREHSRSADRKPATLDRRTLLAGVAGGAALAIGCAPGGESDTSGSARLAAGGWTPPSGEERRALVSTAHFGPKRAVRSANGLAICTHPLAAAAAADMIALGGNACDGVLAASIAQAVVEPHMTTLSGCLSMLYYDAASGEYSYVNGMMAAPQAVPDVRSMDVAEFGALMAKTDGALCFVPGFWGGFEAGHDRHGRLPRATVMAPAIHYARHGFEIHPFLWGEMFVESSVLGREAFSREIYFRGSTLRDIGDTLVQNALADTLERLVEDGSDHFYRGEFGRRYAETVQAKGGLITAGDMASYDAFWDEPVHGTYRDYGVVGSPSVSLTENIVQNSVNLLDFGLDLETSVHKPRFGGSSMNVPGALMVEADLPGEPARLLREAGATVDVVNPWNWLCGSFEGVLVEEDGAVACGDPRRTAQAVAV